MIDLSGRTALITGASAGLGAEFARQLHYEGCRIVLAARRKERLEKLASELNEKRAASALALPVDLTMRGASGEPTSLDKFAELAAAQKPDIFINNAGVGSFGEFESIPFEHEKAVIDLNVFATTYLAHHMLKGMRARGFGVYVSISSVAGFQPLPYMSSYAASKAFNLHHTLALRHELRGSGVSAHVVCPGPTDTEFFGVSRFATFPPDIVRADARSVVKESIRSIKRGKCIIVPGWRAKFMALGARLAPLRLSTWLSGRYLRRSL